MGPSQSCIGESFHRSAGPSEGNRGFGCGIFSRLPLFRHLVLLMDSSKKGPSVRSTVSILTPSFLFVIIQKEYSGEKNRYKEKIFALLILLVPTQPAMIWPDISLKIVLMHER